MIVARPIDEALVRGDHAEAMRRDVSLCRCWRHVVMDDGTGGQVGIIARRAIDDDQTTASPQCTKNGVHDRVRRSQLVIGVRDEGGVDCRSRQTGIASGAALHRQRVMTSAPGADPQERQRLAPQIDGNDLSLRRDTRRHLEREVSGAGSKIHHRLTGPQIEVAQHVFRALPCVAFAFDDSQGTQRADRLSDDDGERQCEGDQSSRGNACLHRPYSRTVRDAWWRRQTPA